MPSFHSKSNASNYYRSDGTPYNSVFRATPICMPPRKFYPYPVDRSFVLANFDVSGAVSVDKSFNPQYEDPGMRWAV